MAVLDGFFELDEKERDDALGPAHINATVSNQTLLRKLLGVEHLLSSASGVAGEHNAREIPRSFAYIEATGGPPATSYTVHCDDGYITGMTTPGSGELRLTLAANKFDADKMVVKVSSLSSLRYGSGPYHYPPALHSVNIVSDTDVRIYTTNISYSVSPFSGTELWVPLRTDLAVAIFSEPLTEPPLVTNGITPNIRGQSLRYNSVWNRLAARDANLRKLIAVSHDPDTGEHADWRIPKAVGHITWDGSDFFLDTDNSVGISGVTTLGGGGDPVYCEVQLDYSPATAFYPMVSADYARSNGGAPGDAVAAHCPLIEFDTDTFNIYSATHDGTYWQNDPTDVWVAVYSD